MDQDLSSRLVLIATDYIINPSTSATRSASATARRSSSFASAGRQSLAPLSSTPHHASLSSSSSNNNLPDPRQIRNPTFQKQCRDQLSEYLLSSRCNLPLTSKTLISPTTKEFQSIFKWLITSPDALGYSSGYTQSLEVGAKGFEAECVQVLKDLKYPTDVGKTALGAPGSPTNWPTILVMLVWLSELAKVRAGLEIRFLTTCNVTTIADSFSSCSNHLSRLDTFRPYVNGPTRTHRPTRSSARSPPCPRKTSKRKTSATSSHGWKRSTLPRLMRRGGHRTRRGKGSSLRGRRGC